MEQTLEKPGISTSEQAVLEQELGDLFAMTLRLECELESVLDRGDNL